MAWGFDSRPPFVRRIVGARSAPVRQRMRRPRGFREKDGYPTILALILLSSTFATSRKTASATPNVAASMFAECAA